MTKPAWLNPTEDTAWRGLRRVNVVTLAAIGADLNRDSNLSDADYEILTNLSETDDDQCRFKELATRARWSTSRLSHHLERKEQRGLIERRPTPDDARGSDIHLTTLGRQTIEDAAPAHVASVRHHIFDRLSAQQVAQLANIVTALVPPGADDAPA
jgi:DNA-binding MarR family transcriptional regulator